MVNKTIYIDHNGTMFFKYALTFDYDDACWGLELWAKDDRDANRKLEALKKTVRLEGKILGEQDE